MSHLMAAGEAFSGKIRINARRRHADALEPLRSRFVSPVALLVHVS
jgi:hypothetical protein